MPDARMFLYGFSPMTQRRASTRLDLPQPFGPTTPVRPRSMMNSVGSTKDLKPTRRSLLNFMPPPHQTKKRARGFRRRPPSQNGTDQRRLSMRADKVSTGMSPE